MAVRKSTLISNLDLATPQMPPTINGNQVVKTQGITLVKSSAWATNDQMWMLRLWSSWRIRALWFQCAAWGTSGVIDIGAYYAQIPEIGAAGAVIDADIFATDVDVSAAVAKIDLLTEALTAAARGQRLWEVLGLSADPLKWIDIVIDANNIGGAQNAATWLEAEYVE